MGFNVAPMRYQTEVWRAALLPAALRRAALYGGAYAVLGMSFLTYAAVCIPIAQLSSYGWAIFSVSAALMLWGLLPYARLKQQQMHPNELQMHCDGTLLFSCRGKVVHIFDSRKICTLAFFQSWRSYGIAVEYEASSGGSRDKIFLPFLSRRSYEELVESLDS